MVGFRNVAAKLAVLCIVALGLVACTDGWTSAPEGSGGGYSRSFNKRFHYYYGEDCRYDAFGQPYECSDIYSLRPYVTVSLSITYDGYATLCVDDQCTYYDPGEYYEGYDHGDRYYDFTGDDTRMTVYADGSEMIYINSYKGYAYYYYVDNPDDYDYYY